MLPHEAAGLADIRKVYGAPVTYTGDGAPIAGLIAIRSDIPADPDTGFGGRAARISFEIDKADLDEEPARDHTIVEASGALWRVIDADERTDIDAWVVFVEELS